MTEEIERMMTECIAPYTKDSPLLITRPPAPAPVALTVTPKLHTEG